MEQATTDKTCGTCCYCVKDDGHPYCVIKDLYTPVELDDVCDEFDLSGNEYWTEGIK